MKEMVAVADSTLVKIPKVSNRFNRRKNAFRCLMALVSGKKIIKLIKESPVSMNDTRVKIK
jgi:hypothetical protein